MKLLDRTILLALLLIAAGLFLSTFSNEYDIPSFGGDVSTVFVPRIYFIIWILLCLFSLWDSTNTNYEDKDGEETSFSVARLCTIILIAAATSVAMLKLGFVIGLIPGFILFCWSFGYRRPLVLTVISVSGTLGIWLLFNNVFELPLPRSPWFHLF